MEDLDYYMRLNYRIEVTKSEEIEGYYFRCPELMGCFVYARTIEQGFEMIEQAKESWLSDAMQHGSNIPEPDEMNGFSGQFKLRIPKSLHKMLSERSRQEGISMNQYCLYLLSSGVGGVSALSKEEIKKIGKTG